MTPALLSGFLFSFFSWFISAMSLFYFLYPPDTKSLPFIKKMHYASDMTDMGKIRLMISEYSSQMRANNQPRQWTVPGRWAAWPTSPWKDPFCPMVVTHHTLTATASFTFVSGVFTGNCYFAMNIVKSGVFLVQLSWFPGFLSLVRTACCTSNEWVPKYPGPEPLPLSPFLSISRKSTPVLRGLAGAVTTGSCSWEKGKRNVVIAASFLVSTKPVAKGSWEVDDVGRTDISLHSSGRIPEE